MPSPRSAAPTPSSVSRGNSGYAPRTRSSTGSYQPPSNPSSGRYVPRSSDRGTSSTITRSVGGPVSSNPRTPNNSNDNRVTTTRTPRTTTSNTSDRYAPTRRDTPSSIRSSGRYQPSDQTGAVTRAPRTGSPKSTVRSGVSAPSSNRVVRSAPRTTVKGLAPVSVPRTGGIIPNAVPRLASPRLAAPRLSSPRLGSTRLGAGGFIGNVGFRSNGWGSVGCNTGLWNGYWGYGRSNLYCGIGGWGGGWGFNNWGGGWGFGNWGGGWGFGNWGCSPFSWTIASYRTNFWNNCYRNCYWSNWSIPNALPSNYWWYPTTTYCPTYLYVPSSVIVEEEAALPAAEPLILSVVDRARSADTARNAVKDISKSNPEMLATQYVELGDFYFKNDRFDAAAEAYGKARKHAPEDASVHFVLADAVFANGDYHYAAFLIAEAVRLDPAIVTADVDKRAFYSDEKLFETQLEALQSYCSEKPYDAWAQLVLGYNLRFSDRPTRSVAAFRRVLELDSGNPTARAFLTDLVPALRTDAPAASATEMSDR